MKRLLLTVILGMMALFSSDAADLVFHFDFKDKETHPALETAGRSGWYYTIE